MTYVDGFWWPTSDRECQPAVMRELTTLRSTVDRVPDKIVAVQAGGNVGVWPIYLSQYFEEVFTFEPDPENFECLVRNIAERDNIHAFPCALADTERLVGLHRLPRNVGAHRILLEDGGIPAMSLDHFYYGHEVKLDRCDLLCLDVEGSEHLVVNGASRLISEKRPVIRLEDKGLSQEYGYERGQVVETLKSDYGYVVVEEVMRDLVLTCQN